MKNKFLLTILTAVLLFSFPELNYGQAPNLGAAANFVFYTSIGAVAGSSSVSHINGGDAGTNNGAITGFENSTLSGQMHNADALTSQASKDLLTAYFQMKNTVTTVGTHANAFGSNEVLVPGVYGLAGAVSIAGTLTLDGQNNSNSVFIFKTTGGAFTTGSYAKIILINGASACNVAWVIEGAVTFGAYSNMQGTFISYNGAVKMLTGSTLTGRGYTTNGAVTVDAVNVSIPTQCGDYIATTWIGKNSTDWNLASNWNNQIVPTAATKITIPGGSLNYPILNSGIDTVGTITISNGASLTITGSSTLKISGAIINQGIFDASAGTIEMNGKSAQTIPPNAFLNNNIYNLIISNNVTLGGQLNLTGSLSFGNSNDSLFTGDSLTFKSTINGTARLADITNGGNNSGNAIVGKSTIERYVSAKRAWRLMSVPVTALGAPTINMAWQEGVGGNSTANPNPGYGVQITGGTIAHGFDQGVNSNPSIKVYNSTTNTLNPIASGTGTNTPISTYPAYFLFIRGDRSTQLSQGSAAALTPTTLRMKGQVFTGDNIINVQALNATLVGNPYPSAIDFHALIKNNVNDKIYVWDPKMNGGSGVGGYITLIWNDADGGYDKTTAASTGVSQYIQSGEAFFVESSDGINPGTLRIREINKYAGGNDLIFKPIIGNPSKKIRINLFAMNAASSELSDGVLTTYNNANSNAVDKNDANKLYNSAENICIAREGKDLAIERRKNIDENDTTFLNLYTLKKQKYKLEITTDGMNRAGLHALVKDKYLGGQKDTAINMNGITDVVFTVNSDPASYAVSRFSIVFKQDFVVLPVTFSSLKAYRLLEDIVVEWKTQNEVQVKNYEVETSADGIDFIKAFSVNAKAIVNNDGSQAYSWTDKYVADGLHYYRIKSIDVDGKYSYSKIVNEDINKGLNKKYITVYDNIVKDNQFLLGLYNIDKGNYILKIISMDGRLVEQCKIEHAGGNGVRTILIKNYFPSGKYELILSDKSFNYHTSLIKK